MNKNMFFLFVVSAIFFYFLLFCFLYLLTIISVSFQTIFYNIDSTITVTKLQFVVLYYAIFSEEKEKNNCIEKERKSNIFLSIIIDTTVF